MRNIFIAFFIRNVKYANFHLKEVILWKVIIVVIISLFFSYLYLNFYYFSIIFVLAIAAASLFIQRRTTFIYFLLFLVPIDRFFFPIFYRFKIYQLAILLALIFEVLNARRGVKKLRSWFNFLDLSILLIYVGRILSYFICTDSGAYFKSIILNGFFVLLYFYIRMKSRTTKSENLLQFMLYSSIFFILFGISEFILAKLGFGSLRISEEIFVYGGRPMSVFREPDWFGGYLTFIIGLTIPFLSVKSLNDRKYFINKLIFYLALPMCLLIVVRSAWLGLIAGIVFLLFLAHKSRKFLLPALTKVAIVILLFLVLVFLISPIYYKSIHDRFFSLFSYLRNEKFDSAALTRINSYTIILEYIKQKPLQGYGAGAWEFLSQRHKYINPSLSTNNILLTPIFELGILGVILYLLFFFALFQLIYRGLKRATTDTEMRYVIGISIAIIGTLVVAIFNDITLTGFYWCFIAIFNNYIEGCKKQKLPQ